MKKQGRAPNAFKKRLMVLRLKVSNLSVQILHKPYLGSDCSIIVPIKTIKSFFECSKFVWLESFHHDYLKYSMFVTKYVMFVLQVYLFCLIFCLKSISTPWHLDNKSKTHHHIIRGLIVKFLVFCCVQMFFKET